MFGCRCFYWSRVSNLIPSTPENFYLPAPTPQWPQGGEFSTGRINLGDLEVLAVTEFEYIWGCDLLQEKKTGVAFYKPLEIPDGFFSLGHYCQTNDHPLHGFVLVARDVTSEVEAENFRSPALQKPTDYTLVWTPEDGSDENQDWSGYIWLPQAPEGYKSMGYLVTRKPQKPDLDEVRCVRADLTDECEAHHQILDLTPKLSRFPFQVWTIRPRDRGMLGRGVCVGTFFCSSYCNFGEELCIACLKNSNPSLLAMPNLDQIHALINHYGPTIFFHPDEVYLASSVSWFFRNGAQLHRKGDLAGEQIEANGSNLPRAGTNDGQYWIDLPCDDRKEITKRGNLESAVLYVHVKPALGGTFTDIVMWVFCPFNGAATLKVGIMNIPLNKVGQHVGDWEHFTLRISNFTGELWSVYFSQHSGGEWVDACNLDFIEGNKCIVYSSKNGHASFPHKGSYLQGSAKLGIGIRNDAARGDLFVDSSTRYEIVAAEYLGDRVVPEPAWLQFMREWGPKITYDSRAELNKLINVLPQMVRSSVKNIFNKLPIELYGEEGPTGPKEKNNWVGDERS